MLIHSRLNIKFTILLSLLLFFSSFFAFSQSTIDKELLVAASKNNEKKIYDLLRRGADVNVKTYEGVTPLMFAVDYGNYQICIKLLENGADINISPPYNPPALMAAVSNNDFEITELLIINGANVNIENYNKKSPIHVAIDEQNYEIVDLLLFYGASPNKTYNYSNPILQATQRKDTTLAKILIKYKANIDKKNDFGNYPLLVSVKKNDINFVKLLVENKAKITSQAIGVAIENNNNEILEYLIVNGADTKQKIDNKLPYEFAIISENNKAKKILRQHGAKKGYIPIVSHSQIGYVNQFTSSDYMIGAAFGFQEKRYKIDFLSGLVTRPFRKKIWLKQDEHLYYQIEEKRTLAYVEINKRFNFLKNNSTVYGAFFGGKAMYSFGYYNATSIKLNPETLFSPVVGIYIKSEFVYLKFNYEYLDFGEIKHSPHWFGISFFLLLKNNL